MVATTVAIITATNANLAAQNAARLFAAAPALLKCLMAYVNEAQREGNQSPEVDDAKLAIAKALGE